VKTCATCSRDFVPGSNRARYCSDDCRKAARRERTPKAEPVGVVGSRRDGFRVVINGVEAVWRPRYLREDRERLSYLDRAADATEDLSGLATFEGSRHGGGIRAVSLRDDDARRWAIEAHGVDIGAGL